MVRNKTKKNLRKRSQKRNKKADQEKRDQGLSVQSVPKEAFPTLSLLGILLIIVAILSSVYLFYIKDLESAKRQIQQELDESVRDKIKDYTAKYPKGIKIVTFENNEMIESSIDTLPQDLRINWKKVSLLRVSPELSRDNPSAAKIQLPQVTYDIYGISAYH